ncbi:E3 ubiquitin-protein ligase midline-1 [Plakobranchus ocellatus]|uniref:E3 ubiquitin-protein ligase midline-1 n=1 Tax=Plakobranchus ocellatus TaxID=259542 RepID=A0AAV4BXG2_9GAST|nr:E3 ubiquitin-protein ligase midline-1 [Plakobranchus ocellatus]
MAVSHGVTDELICSICLEMFSTPVLLPCAHTFCKQCLTNVHERSRIRNTPQEGSSNSPGSSRQADTGSGESSTSVPASKDRPIVCPHCRAEFQLGPEGINGLPRNTTLANIILSIEEEKRAKRVLCEVCDFDPARTASKSCADCAVTYCAPCFQQLHPMRGTFRYHLIKDAVIPTPRCASPFFEFRSPKLSIHDGYGTDGVDSGDEGGMYTKPDLLEKVRRQIKSKRKELNSVMKTVQSLLKTTEEETEERMREVRSMCGQINESVGEKEANLLTAISTQRHEAVKQCLALTSEVKAQTQSLDLLEDQVNDIVALTAVHSGTDASNDIASIQERVTSIQSRALTTRAKQIPRQPKLGKVRVEEYVASLEFVKDAKLLSLHITDIVHRPVSSGPALVEVKWRALEDNKDVRLSAKSKDPRGFDVITTVSLNPSMTSYLMSLPWVNAEYTVTLEATAVNGAKCPPISKPIRTMPYVHCFKARFNPSTCHKRIAVSSGRDEVVHRKCKMANLQSACAMMTSFQRLEKLEGAMADECLPILPYVYWETIVHFQVFGKLGDSKLLCDVGICKQGTEDASSLLCDNQKSYCAYLVRRNNSVALEFWNGPNRDTLPRSIPILDLTREKEKSLRLGFYYDAMKRVVAIVSPGNNTILAQFYVKSTNLVPVCGLYCFEQVFTMVKFTDPHKLPTVLCKLMKWSHGS